MTNSITCQLMKSGYQVSTMKAKPTMKLTHNIEVKIPDKQTIADVKVKVDTGAQGNALPVRMFKSMYPDRVNAQGHPKLGVITITPTVLTAYNGTIIPHYGTIKLTCKFKQNEWLPT